MRKWSIGTKLMAGFMGLVVCVAALGLASLWAVNGLRDDLGEMSEKILRRGELAADIQVNTWNVRGELRAALLAAALKRPQDVQKARTSAEQAFTRLDSALQEIRPLLADEKAKAAAAGIASILPQWKDAFHEVADLAAAGKVDAAYKVRAEKEAPLAVQIEEAPTVIREGQRVTADQKLTEANQRAISNRWIIVAIIAAGMFLGLLVFFMVRNLAGTLRYVTTELASGADQVAAASGQIATTSQSLSQGASEQASSVEEISASMEEMTAMTRTSGANSSEAMAMMVETALQVERSNAALSEMVASMSSIKSSSERVAKINKTIDEIAFQTNILALNAAVEAARAGEAGKGFAVVADEVRNLAQRAAAAAKDTAALIEESIANSNQGAQKLELVSAAIQGITEGAQKVKQLVGEVNEAGKQQVQGIQQVSTAIQQVSTVTQTSASSAEESAAAAEELNAQSMTVRELVNQLKVMVDGGEAQGATRTHTAAHFTGGRGSARPAAPSAVKKTASAHADDAFPMEGAESGSFRSF
jgi:methyl-accepting chemotaxis protein